MKSLPITAVTALLLLKCAQPEAVALEIERKPLIRHKIEINGHPFAAYEKRANAAAEIIVLIHGKTISALPNFDLQFETRNVSLMDAFVAKGFTTYAIDLRGFGNTPRDNSGWITPNKAANDVVKMLEWVASRHPKKMKPTLFGYSQGAKVSQMVAQKKPILVSNLVLFGHPVATPAIAAATLERPPESAGKPPRKPNTIEWSSDGFIAESVSREVIDLYVSACLRMDPILADWNRVDQWDQLKPEAINVPTLLISGEHDPYAPADKHTSFFRNIGCPDKAWVIIANSGHNAHIENTAPRLVNGVAGFVRRNNLEPGRPKN